MMDEIDVIDWEAYVQYMEEWDEYMKDYQRRLEDIPIEEIEIYLKKQKLKNIEI